MYGTAAADVIIFNMPGVLAMLWCATDAFLVYSLQFPLKAVLRLIALPVQCYSLPHSPK